jgi:ADP-ribose pyrophosphatase
MSKSPWQTIKSEIIYSNKWMKFIKNEVIHPNGTSGEYTYLDAIPGVVVIAYENDSIYLIKEFKYPINKWIWNLITGGINEGQNPLDVARNELKEEANIIANKWLDLGNFYTAPGIEITDNHTFLATELTVGEFHINGEGDEAINQIRKFNIAEIKEMIKIGEIHNGLVLAALMKFFNYLEKN